ncbi:hypothetical protein GUJ93_ZPchr0008g12376 [Zizania palustris]|uniref:Uncharacterized protein n=1 Tax=Zizania palustris TaxID=103762 RepID=A0A8J5R6H2_ZIZPA|nr:hypothetical protein GUJ93_ZPchr0008g12376 [Zizania palustris]
MTWLERKEADDIMWWERVGMGHRLTGGARREQLGYHQHRYVAEGGGVSTSAQWRRRGSGWGRRLHTLEQDRTSAVLVGA